MRRIGDGERDESWIWSREEDALSALGGGRTTLTAILLGAVAGYESG